MKMPAALRMAIDAKVKRHGSLRAAAKHLGISTSYLSRLRKGTQVNPTVEVLTKLGISVRLECEVRFCSEDNYEVAA